LNSATCQVQVHIIMIRCHTQPLGLSYMLDPRDQMFVGQARYQTQTLWAQLYARLKLPGFGELPDPILLDSVTHQTWDARTSTLLSQEFFEYEHPRWGSRVIISLHHSYVKSHLRVIHMSININVYYKG
jgi:hypothetical protein